MGSKNSNPLGHMNEFVKPIEVSQDNTKAYIRVLAYLESHGRKTLAEISKATSINKNTVRTCLFRLAVDGKVCKTPVGEKGYFQCWQIGSDEAYAQRNMEGKGTGMVQRIVSAWEPCKLRDPMIDMLFGRNA